MKISISYLQRIIPFLFIAAIISCYPDSPDSNDDYDLLISAFNPEFNFETVSSFILPDTLIFLNDTASELIDLTEQQKKAFIDAVRSNITSYGWADSSYSDQDAETLILVSAVVAKYSDNIWDEWKWYEYFGNVSPVGQNTRYPWYPASFPYIYDFTKGTLLLTIIDAEELETNPDVIPVVWIGSLNGIITSKSVSTTKVTNAIDKLFELSPYLNKIN
jgi:hypothetical protein